jgi:neutral ceramidase
MTVLLVTEDAPPAEPIAALVNFTAHPTMVDPAILQFSGEWPGEMCRTMEPALGPDAVALFLNGAQGDQTHSGAQGKDFERVRDYGQRIAKEALKLAEKAKPMSDSTIAVSAEELKMPPYAVAPGFAETTGEEYKIDEKAILAAASKLFPPQAPVEAVRVGGLVLLAVPGEMTAELGMALKNRVREMGAAHPIIAGLANSYVGYIPSPRQYKAGGYEVSTSFYGENEGTAVSDALASRARSVLAGPR